MALHFRIQTIRGLCSRNCSPPKKQKKKTRTFHLHLWDSRWSNDSDHRTTSSLDSLMETESQRTLLEQNVKQTIIAFRKRSSKNYALSNSNIVLGTTLPQVHFTQPWTTVMDHGRDRCDADICVLSVTFNNNKTTMKLAQSIMEYQMGRLMPRHEMKNPTGGDTFFHRGRKKSRVLQAKKPLCKSNLWRARIVSMSYE